MIHTWVGAVAIGSTHNASSLETGGREEPEEIHKAGFQFLLKKKIYALPLFDVIGSIIRNEYLVLIVYE